MQFPDEVIADVRTRLRRVAGQVQGIERMLEEGRECRDIVTQLSAANRERCLLTLLAARGGGFPLATHVYLGLMEGFKEDVAPQDDVSPEEIANIIFLAGVYSGADNLVVGLVTLVRTLKLLRRIANDPDAPKNQDAVFAQIAAEFDIKTEPKPAP